MTVPVAGLSSLPQLPSQGLTGEHKGSLRRLGSGLSKFLLGDRYVLLYLLYLDRELSAGPGNRPAIWNLHTTGISIVRIVNLRGIQPQRRVDVPHQPHQESGLLIEIEVHWRLTLAQPLQNARLAAIDLLRRKKTKISENILHPQRKIECRIEPVRIRFRVAHPLDW